MILADSSVWIRMIRHGEAVMSSLLEQQRILMHPMVLGELVMGNLPRRPRFITSLLEMRCAPLADDDEVLSLIENENLHGQGLGWVDAHLLASVRIDAEVTLWSFDRALAAAAERLSVAARPLH